MRIHHLTRRGVLAGTLRVLAIAAGLFTLAGAARASELIALKDGTLYLGEVLELTKTGITLRTEYPVKGTRKLPLDALADSTRWRLSSRRIPGGDGKARLELGRWAEEHGLLVPALSEYMKAAAIPQFVVEARARIAAVENELALDLLDHGEQYFLEHRPGAAMAYFRMILDRYPKSTSAALAAKRLMQVQAQISLAKALEGAAGGPGLGKLPKTTPAAWAKRYEAAMQHLRQAARYRGKGARAHLPVERSRALTTTVRHIEAARRWIAKLRPAPDDASMAKLRELSQAAKSRLVNAYLALGEAYLERRALNQAEEACTRACDLDPENAAAHQLHRRIIDAKAATGWSAWNRVRGRVSSR